jgi:hypothetical protein
MRQLRKELVELLLTLVQLTAASIVDAKQGHDTVDDEETVLVANEELGDLVQELHLMLRIDGTSVGDVVLCYKVLIRSRRPERVHSLVSGSRPKRSAICAILSGLNVPSVSWKYRQCCLWSGLTIRTDVRHLAFSAAHILR